MKSEGRGSLLHCSFKGDDEILFIVFKCKFPISIYHSVFFTGYIAFKVVLTKALKLSSTCNTDSL